MLKNKPLVRHRKIYWDAIQQDVLVDVILPVGFDPNISYPLLVLNDGQDMHGMNMDLILAEVWKKKVCKPFVLFAPHAYDRMQTYGVAGIPDFKGRGSLAKDYTAFLLDVMIPELMRRLKIKTFEERVIGGFSLGALSAFDIAWNNPGAFSKVLACSASFWWRKKDLKDNYTDADRIMHEVIRKSMQKPPLAIWLACGTLDETSDRNNNGIIDSIDDTLDLVKELETIGFVKGEDLSYNEMIGGRHSLETYGVVLPYFLHWAFGFN